MKNTLELYLKEAYKEKSDDHHRLIYQKIKQFIDSVVLASAGQTLEEKAQSLTNGLFSIREIMQMELADIVQKEKILSQIKDFHKIQQEDALKQKAQEEDQERLDNQKSSKKKSRTKSGERPVNVFSKRKLSEDPTNS